ncbi:MAG: hypothetical protein U0998_05135 [Moraxellaceae bacterium]|nr:hypothetical protein [Moraxellaceae bacterium]MDZ4386591.1 hypothetical protein [Moraxellaceae bacterium]
MMVWWQCGIYKNTKVHSEPKVLIAFKEIIQNELSKSTTQCMVPLTQLGRMPVGSVWLKGKLIQKAQFQTRKFDISFNDSDWNFTSCKEPYNKQAPYPDDLHPFYSGRSDAWLIQFHLQNGGRLVINCLEIFSRLYGRSQEIKRVLSTYPWSGSESSVSSKLIIPVNEPEEPNIWKVSHPDGLVQGDSVFLAHLKYDGYATQSAKQIYAQLEARHVPNQKIPIFPKIRPWHQGDVTIKVAGLSFDNSFLGLHILGCSDPIGPPIVNITNNNAISNLNTHFINSSATMSGQSSSTEYIVTSSEAPDQNKGARSISETAFEVIGQSREVNFVKSQKHVLLGSTQSTNTTSSDPKTTVSGAEPTGLGKGVRKAFVCPAIEKFESEGALRDMWAGLNELRKEYPEKVNQIGWYTFEKGHQYGVEPELIRLQPLKVPNIETKQRNWAFKSKQNKIFRGILIMHLRIKSHDIYFVEIERRPRGMNTGTVSLQEESYKGLAFFVKDPSELKSWLSYFLNGICLKMGIISPLASKCPGHAIPFIHSKSDKDKYIYESIIKSILNKILSIKSNKN